MTVAVTGAAGHAGANLTRALLERGEHVRVLLHNDRRAIEGLDVEVDRGDVCDTESLVEAFKGAQVVYHLAAHISIVKGEGRRCEAVNVAGTRNVVEACRRAGVRRLVHFSSIHATDELSNPSNSRDCPSYDRSKAAGEKEVRRAIEDGLDAVIVCPTAIIGPYDYRPSHFGEALLRMANGRLPALVPGGFDWVDARDVVQGAICAAEKAPTGSRYLLSGHWVSLTHMAVLVAQITGVAAPRFTCPGWLAGFGAPFSAAFDRAAHRRALYTADSLRALRSRREIDCSKAARELGYQPRPFEETIFDTLKWFEQNGKLARPLKKAARPS